MKVEDRHLIEALRLAGFDGDDEDVAEAIEDAPEYSPDLYAHAITLAKLECAVEALERIGWHELSGLEARDLSRSAITQIRSESHE